MDAYQNDFQRVNALIGNPHAPTPSTTDNRSRDRLFRVKKGLIHLLLEVIPQIEDIQQRQEVYLWVSGIHDIVRCEECDAEATHD
ncbi:hypothetical protein IV04_23570 [Serratia sp. Ag1]|nr:hypothetical protein IV04_23570 [Serratia sp. Ag1]